MKLIYWLRNDLRISDNAALTWICENATAECELAFLYAQPPGSQRLGPHKTRFTEESLAELAFALKDRFPIYELTANSPNGAKVTDLMSSMIDGQIGRLTENLDSLSDLTIVYTREHTFDEINEEADLDAFAKRHNVKIQSFDQSTLLSEAELPFSLENLPKVFTAFRQKTEPLILNREFHVATKFQLPDCQRLDLAPFGLSAKLSDGLSVTTVTPKSHVAAETVEDLTERGFRFHGGFKNGQARVSEYLFETDSVQDYFDSRNGMIRKNDSTKFSPWLAVGAISPREILIELRRYETERIKNKSTYWVLFELLWRDFFKYEARRVGKSLFQLAGPNGKMPQICDDDTAKRSFNQWASAQTESEFINANMREIIETGWMSNRGRQNVASYLAKNLEVPWTWGADFFERHLVDYDAAVNWGNWNYFSGVGRDPRDRRFNTTTQENTYDPDGTYRKKWRAR